MTGKIHVNGEIGEEVTLKSIQDDIALYPGATNFEVEIYSGGGDVDEGYAIGEEINKLKAKGIKTVAKINSLCASIATYIACSCDSVEMSSHGSFMIHLPTGTLSGNADDLRRGAARLDRIKSELIQKYMKKVAKKGTTAAQVSEMIEKETDMSPQEAEGFGFIDIVEPKMKIAAYFNPNKMKDEEIKGSFAKFGAKLDEIYNKVFKAKNVAITLADGSTINSDSADPATVAGSMLSDEAGQPLPAGTYETADGIALVVDETGKCVSAEPVTADKEVEALKKENEALKQQIAAAVEAAKKTTEEAVAKIAASQSADFKALKDEFNKLKNATYGDDSAAPDADDKTKGKGKLDPTIEAINKSLGFAFSRN